MKTYLRHKSMNVIDIKELVALEYLDFEGKYKNYTENHDFWEICYVESGEISIFLDGEERNLSQNEIIFISPDTTHSYFSDLGNKNRAFVICFECTSQSLKSLSDNNFSVDDAMLDCLKKIINEFKLTFCINENDVMELLPSPSFGGQQAIMIQLEYLLICLLRKLSKTKNSEIVFLNDESFYAGLTSIIKDFLHKNIRRKLSLEEICGKVNYSRSFICKTFKEQTGETLFEYFNRLKMEEAKRLLSESENSVGEISRELGFSEVKYFGAMFKKYSGTSPTLYRKNNLK